jgi:hypothetical protein
VRSKLLNNWTGHVLVGHLADCTLQVDAGRPAATSRSGPNERPAYESDQQPGGQAPEKQDGRQRKFANLRGRRVGKPQPRNDEQRKKPYRARGDGPCEEILQGAGKTPPHGGPCIESDRGYFFVEQVWKGPRSFQRG